MRCRSSLMSRRHRNLNRGPKSYESTSTMSSIFGALKTIRKVGLKNAGDIKQNGGEFLWTSSGNVFAVREAVHASSDPAAPHEEHERPPAGRRAYAGRRHQLSLEGRHSDVGAGRHDRRAAGFDEHADADDGRRSGHSAHQRADHDRRTDHAVHQRADDDDAACRRAVLGRCSQHDGRRAAAVGAQAHARRACPDCLSDCLR